MNRQQRRQAARAARVAGSAPTELRQILAMAERHRVAGRMRDAEALYRRVLNKQPDQLDSLHWLGVLKHMQGRNETALALLERAAARKQDDAQCLYHLGEVRRSLGHFAEAVASYRQALKHRSDIADVHFGLGTALSELGRAEEATRALRRACDLAPEDPEIHNNLANALAELGQLDAAVSHYSTALELKSDYAEAHMNLGIALTRSGRDEQAEDCYRNAISADPDFVAASLQLARFLRRRARVEEAAKVLHGAVRLHPDHAEAHNELGRCLVDLGRSQEALEHHNRAVDLKPDFAEAHFNSGVCFQSLGRFDEAVAAHEQALALRPGLAEAHYNLSLIKRDGVQGDEVARLEALLAEPDLADEARINVNFALAKFFEEQGDAESAFAHHREGNSLKARSVTFDPDRFLGFVDRQIETFDADFFQAREGWGVASDLPVFIVGMPRSGTTLVEQILASHPAVHGAGELDDIRRMVGILPQSVGGEGEYPECAAEVDRGLAKRLAREYLDSLRRRSPEAQRVTDKMTGNYLRLGLIALMLPEARIVHCRRDALDTCVSCYFQNFAQGLAFTYDLGHLGLVYRQYERLMAHWHSLLPLPILDVRYEDLIADQEAVTRSILEFCDLSWDESCLAFHRQARQVRTASFWQVRQPLYATSIGRWRSFERHLGPLFEALGKTDAVDA